MAKLSLDCCGVEQALKPNQQAAYLRCIAQDSTLMVCPLDRIVFMQKSVAQEKVLPAYEPLA